MLTLFSVSRASGGGINLSTGAVAAISAGIFVAIAFVVIYILIICFLCKLLLEIIKKMWINTSSLPNTGVPVTCWRISIRRVRSRDKKRLNRAICRMIEDPGTEQVCL